MTSPSFVIELPIAVDDAEMRTIVRKLEFARQLHNATLGTAMGQLQLMRQDAAHGKRPVSCLKARRGQQPFVLLTANTG